MLIRSRPEFHESDYGTILILEVRNGRNRRVDISEACALEIFFMRPDGTAFSRPGCLFPAEDSFKPDGFDGRFYYVIQPGDLIPAGNWFLQGYIDLGGGAWYTSTVSFVVFPNLISLVEVLQP